MEGLMTMEATAETKISSSRGLISWWIGFAVDTILLALLLWRPLWLVPPYMQYTIWIYLVLIILWIVLLVGAVHKTRALSLLASWYVPVVSIMVVSAVLFFARFSILAIFLISWMVPFCEITESQGSTVSYSCPNGGPYGIPEFESRRGLPIMW
jgi:hypothetical protein